MIASALEQTSPRRDMVLGLDSLRLFAALSVAVSHLAANMPVEPDSQFGAQLWRIAELGTNGRVAVALFFVISGFCIHLRQAESLRIDPTDFIIRRGLRIGLPLVAVVLLANTLGGWAVAAVAAVLWSVYCEMIYYAFYPVLLAIRRRYSMGRILIVSSLLSAALVTFDLVFQWGALRHGPSLAYCLPLFPLWLLGAWLAERHGKDTTMPSTTQIICWRAGAVLLCVIANLIKIHDLRSAAWLLYAGVGLFCVFYLPRELARWNGNRSTVITERLGRASYSLYLVHILPISLVIQLSTSWPFWTLLLAQVIAIALITFCFYVLCEAPAHRLARTIRRRTLAGNVAATPAL